MAQETEAEPICRSLDWNEYNYGTNMQHGFQLARQILGRQKGAQPADHHHHRRRADRALRERPGPLQLPADAAHVPGDAAGGHPLHPRRHHDQHLHAGALALHDAVRQRPDAHQQRPRLRRHARTASANTSWSTTSPTSASSWRDECRPSREFRVAKSSAQRRAGVTGGKGSLAGPAALAYRFRSDPDYDLSRIRIAWPVGREIRLSIDAGVRQPIYSGERDSTRVGHPVGVSRATGRQELTRSIKRRVSNGWHTL